ncbi:uncharacterized protein LOC143205085 isoform X2 [Rhynchophorus ferrugineus]|uniref:Uncharacterized protein n=1 Tax=Rhynchophorus ferrugineus TaxID=354439 RepID=A0A834IGG8_RHYFE|nr:hypothetical protein GWI33_006196 [Rhynchophorus ferrugineus]
MITAVYFVKGSLVRFQPFKMLIGFNRLKTAVTKIKWDCLYVFAFLHLSMTILGIYTTIKDMIDEEFPVSTYEILYVVGHFILHFLLIGCLIAGQRYEKPVFLLLWLVVNFMFFSMLTLSFFKSLNAPINRTKKIFLFNVTALGVLWTFWVVILRRYRYFRNKPVYIDLNLQDIKTY